MVDILEKERELRVESLAEQAFFSTVRIEAGHAQSEWTGTGFFHGIDLNGRVYVSIVTNKHVLANADWIRLNVISRTAHDQPDLGVGRAITIRGDVARAWIGHPDPLVDVAILPTGTFWGGLVDGDGRQPFYTATLESNMYDPRTDDLDAIETVTFVGYPDGLHDRVHLLPIARRGTTATPIDVDYNGRPAFLIDAPVFGGSSGSPVFVIQDGVRRDRMGNMVMSEAKLILLGVLAAVHVRQVTGVVQDLPASHLIGEFRMDQELDLGMVYRSDAIRTCVGIARAVDHIVSEAQGPEDGAKRRPQGSAPAEPAP